ncbi:MAG: PaaI family thioesterase, partial [Actinobacteria bacterium]|nr:PaaI family thioesterase [Actinomycetota bacterium]
DEDESWRDIVPGPRGGAAFADLHQAQRRLQDRLSGAVLPDDLAKQVAARLQEIGDLLAEHQGAEAERYDGWRPDLPGRGHPLLPPYVIDAEDDSSLSGRVTFTRFYLGGNGAVHGGAHSLLFDDLLGRVMNHHQPGVARTAALTVNYRRITPIDVELRFEASRDRVEGRKRWGSARLFDPSGALVSDTSTLFLQLLPGQQ